MFEFFLEPMVGDGVVEDREDQGSRESEHDLFGAIQGRGHHHDFIAPSVGSALVETPMPLSPNLSGPIYPVFGDAVR